MPEAEQEPLRYAVLMAGSEHWRVPEIAAVLSRLRQEPLPDSLLAARKAWGIIEEDVPKEKGLAAAQALSAAGLSALAIPRALVEELPPSARVSRLGLSAEGLLPECEGAAGPALKAWGRLSLVAAAGFEETTLRKVKAEEEMGLGRRALNIGLGLLMGLPGPLGPGRREVEKTLSSHDLVLSLDLVLKEPAERLRIDAQDFDFSCLKRRMVYDVWGNFKQLVGELCDRAAGAGQNRGAKALLEGRPLREVGYESLQDLERECRWLLTLAALKA